MGTGADQARGIARLARLADTYVAAFLAPKLPEGEATVPLSGYMWDLSTAGSHDPRLDDAAQLYAAITGVFHWWLAFPQVAAQGGFTVMLGNPPWERIKLQEEEFFAASSPLVAVAKNKAERAQRIELLRQGLLLHTPVSRRRGRRRLEPTQSGRDAAARGIHRRPARCRGR